MATKNGFDGISLPCPCCGDATANIDVQLGADDTERFHCGECDAAFGADLIEAIVRKWVPVLRWVDAFPAKEIEAAK